VLSGEFIEIAFFIEEDLLEIAAYPVTEYHYYQFYCRGDMAGSRYRLQIVLLAYLCSAYCTIYIIVCYLVDHRAEENHILP
jgi:hypothetical protein